MGGTKASAGGGVGDTTSSRPQSRGRISPDTNGARRDKGRSKPERGEPPRAKPCCHWRRVRGSVWTGRRKRKQPVDQCTMFKPRETSQPRRCRITPSVQPASERAAASAIGRGVGGRRSGRGGCRTRCSAREARRGARGGKAVCGAQDSQIRSVHAVHPRGPDVRHRDAATQRPPHRAAQQAAQEGEGPSNAEACRGTQGISAPHSARAWPTDTAPARPGTRPPTSTPSSTLVPGKLPRRTYTTDGQGLLPPLIFSRAAAAPPPPPPFHHRARLEALPGPRGLRQGCGRAQGSQARRQGRGSFLPFALGKGPARPCPGEGGGSSGRAGQPGHRRAQPCEGAARAPPLLR